MAVSQRNRCPRRGRDRLKASAGWLVDSQQPGTPHQSELCKGGVYVGWGWRIIFEGVSCQNGVSSTGPQV